MLTNSQDEVKQNVIVSKVLKEKIEEHMLEFPDSNQNHLNEINSGSLTILKLKQELEYHKLCEEVINKQIHLKDKDIVTRITYCNELNIVLKSVLFPPDSE